MKPELVYFKFTKMIFNITKINKQSQPPGLVTIVILLLMVDDCHGFIEYENDNTGRIFFNKEISAEALVFIRPFVWAAQLPSTNFTESETDHIAGGIIRFYANGKFGNNFDWNFNLASNYIADEFELLYFLNDISSRYPERSGRFSKTVNEDKQQEVVIDHWYGRYTFENTDFIFGRQPINLASTFYFTPNDFFAPFSAQTFFRDFKAGVDALRIEHALGNLNQFSLFYVLGYQLHDPDTLEYEDNPEGRRASKLAQFSTVFADFEWRILAGRIFGNPVYGLALQGQLGDFLGLRAEGHHRRGELQHSSQWALGLEHQFTADLGARIEFFYNSKAVSEKENYYEFLSQSINIDNQSNYWAAKYLAAGFNYQISPLWMISNVVLMNLIDNSYLVVFDFNYSLSNESTLNFGMSIPEGDRPELSPGFFSPLQAIQSEFGSYPKMLTLELRWYF